MSWNSSESKVEDSADRDEQLEEGPLRTWGAAKREVSFRRVPATVAEVLRLYRAGFDRISVFDATPFFTGDPRIRPGCRTFYLARKSTDASATLIPLDCNVDPG
jgi:hypothetical protein